MKGEIHGLVQAVSFLVSLIHERLNRSEHVANSWPRSQGFRYSIERIHSKSVEAKIYPAGWPSGSHIILTYDLRPEGNWMPSYGTFHAPHIAVRGALQKKAVFRFMVEYHRDRSFVFEKMETGDIVFINALNLMAP